MPKVTYDSNKGLFQEAGSGVNFGGNTSQGSVKKVYTINLVDLTLSTADSGCIVKLLDTTGGIDVTLPIATAGFTFIVTYAVDTPGGNTTFIPGSGTVKVIQAKAGNNTHAPTSNAKLRCQSTNSKKGNSAIVTCDGTDWYVQAIALSNHDVIKAVA